MSQHRPTGITIIAVLMIIGGLILIFTGITPLFLGPLISIDISNYPISALGLLITIGSLVLVGLGIGNATTFSYTNIFLTFDRIYGTDYVIFKFNQNLIYM
ncbi:MAG: hypothetical protein ACXWE0_03410 [Nitrososphaeraceae archaeon]